MSLSNVQKAFVFMVISSLFGSTIAVSMKMLSFHLSIAVIFFATRVFIFCGAIPTIIKYKKSILHSQNKMNIALVSVFYIAAMYCYFYSLTMIPMSISSLFFNSAPLYVPILAYFILNDMGIRSVKLWIAMGISFAGVLLILLPHDHVFYSHVGMSVAFLSGAFIAFWQVLTKRVTGSETPHRIAFFQMITSIVITFFPAAWIVSHHGIHYLDGLWTIKNMSALILAGISSWIYQLYRTRAMHYAPVSLIMPFGYLGVLFVGIFDLIFWHVMPSVMNMIGMMIVIIGVVLLLHFNKSTLKK